MSKMCNQNDLGLYLIEDDEECVLFIFIGNYLLAFLSAAKRVKPRYQWETLF